MKPPPIPPLVTGVILAAGRSTRMGRDKAFLTLADGVTLVARQAALLRSLHLDDLLISARARTDYGVPDARHVYDAVPDAGPLAGISAALNHATRPHLLVLAVDLPRVTPALLKSLLNHCSLGAGAVPATPRGFEPLCAIYPNTPDSRRALTDALATNALSLQHLLRSAVDAGWMRSLPMADNDLPLLANWNSPDELPKT